MIESLTVTADAKTPVPWWNKVFKEHQSWEFKPGINILWGPNGSGKSTILTLLARLHCCEHTGYSKVTKLGFSNVFADLKDGFPSGIEVKHDGQEVRVFNTGKVIGSEFGMAAFDFEVDNPMDYVVAKGSSGQLNVHRLGQVLKPALRNEIEWVNKPNPNFKPEPGQSTQYHDQQMWLLNYLKGSIKKGAPTILMDEPDVGMDWTTKQMLWDLIQRSSAIEQKQYIIASHSMFAMMMPPFPGANMIELKPGYLEECRKVVNVTVQMSGK